MKAAGWIDRVKKTRGWETDYRVAKELDVSHTTLSKYRTRPESTMDDALALKVAHALDLEPHIIIIDQVAERSPVPMARESLTLAKSLLEKLTKPRKGPRLGGGGAVDITLSASTAPGGEPDRQWAPALKTMACDPGEIRDVAARNTHRINQPTGALQLLADYFRALVAPVPRRFIPSA